MEKNFGFFKGLLLFIFISLACLFILHIPEVTGLSDNGDFGRVTTPNNIFSISPDNATLFFQDKYISKITQSSFFNIILELIEENTEHSYDYTSSQFIFIKCSKILNYMFNLIFNQPIEYYNIAFLSILYIIPFSYAFVLIYASFRTNSIFKNWLILTLFILIFLDLSYIIYFNSFYGEGLQYCSFMLITAILIYVLQQFRNHKYLNSFCYFLLFIFFVFVYIFSASKAANLPIGLIFSLAGIIICLFCTKKTLKYLLISLGFCSICFSCCYLTKTPTWMNDVTNYHSLFYGILKNTDNVYEALDFFNIDAKYSYLANTHAYIEEYQKDINTNEFKQDVYTKISKGKVFNYYLTHPDRFIQKTCISLKNAEIIKPIYLANYIDNGEHKKLQLNDKFSIWSNLRQLLNITNPIIFSIICTGIVIYICISFIIYIRNIKNTDKLTNVIIYATLFVSLIFALVIPFIGNGEADLQKHMFLFNNIFDVLIAIILASIIVNFSTIISFFKKHKSCMFVSISAVTTLVLLSSISVFDSTQVKEISFGAYNNKEIIWEVIAENNTSFLLISKEPIIQMPFDINNSNCWINSSVREFLNTTLYNCFSLQEKEKLLNNTSTVLISQYNRDIKTSGNFPYYLSPFPELQDVGIDSYYKTTCNDYVFLLNVFEYDKYIAKNGLKKKNMAFITPYTNNANMIQYIDKSGHIYINDANLNYCIYPCITISKL